VTEPTAYGSFGPPGDADKSYRYIEKMEQRIADLDERVRRLEEPFKRYRGAR
jgi:hypothetical protein